MSKIDDGGPASKATLRDLFAAVVIHAKTPLNHKDGEAWVAQVFSDGDDDRTYDELIADSRQSGSESAYRWADAMLAARKAVQP